MGKSHSGGEEGGGAEGSDLVGDMEKSTECNVRVGLNSNRVALLYQKMIK